MYQKKQINYHASQIDANFFKPKFNIVGSMDFCDYDYECYEIIKSFEPYGEANPKPLFFAKDTSVVHSQKVGQNQDHLKLILKSDKHHKKAMAFFNDKKINKGEKLDLIFTLYKNYFRNEINFEFRVVEFLKTCTPSDTFNSASLSGSCL